jgi:hypothetical protein
MSNKSAEEIRAIKIKALAFYSNITLAGLKGMPLKWIENVFANMIDEKQGEATERIKALMDFIIKELSKSEEERK